jgi:PBP1b-binding outer membrane lipoprotein LpoB
MGRTKTITAIRGREAIDMKMLKALAIVAILSLVLVSGCTQTPSTGGVVNKATEDTAASALESELNQAIANMSE